MSSNSGGLIGLLISLAVASAVGFFAMAALMVLGDWSLLQALFAAAVIFVVLGGLFAYVFSGPTTGPVEPGSAGMHAAAREAAPDPAPAAQAAPVTAPAPEPAPEPEPAPAPEPEPEAAVEPEPTPTPEPEAAAPAEAGEPVKPAGLEAAREGGADDLKKIKGVGPKLEQLLNSMGFFHFDQVAAWTETEVAWVDENLVGFKGRVSRDNWVEQAKHLAAGGETEFSRKVDEGDVY